MLRTAEYPCHECSSTTSPSSTGCTPHLLPVESGCTPYARVSERAREVFVHEARDVLHGLTAVEYERPSPVWRAARCLGVDAGDAKMAEQPGADLAEALPRGCRHGEGRIAKPRDLQEDPQLGVRISEALHLVCHEQRGKLQCEGILVAFSGGFAGRLPAIGERYAALAQDRAYGLDLIEARGVTEIDDQQRCVRRLQRAREPRDRVLGRDGRKVHELQGDILVGNHAGLGILGRSEE